MVPRVSVALPVWNAETFLSEAVESILAQTLDDLELVVVDDGSTDRTPDILRGLQAHDPRLRVYRQANAGFVSAVNTAIQLCSANYIARMDADDVAVSDRLERQCQFLDRHPDVGMVGGSVVIVDSQGSVLRTLPIPESDQQLRAALRSTNPFCDPAVLIRGSVLRRAGGYRRAFGPSSDYDLWLRISESYKLGAVAAPVLHYRWHDSQLSTRDIHTQLIGLVAARHASRLRRATGTDPFDEMDSMSIEGLSQSGLDLGQIQSELLLEAAARAAVMVSIGRLLDARELLDAASSRTRPGPSTNRRARAHVGITYARLSASESEWIDAFKWLLVAAALDPIAVGLAAWRGLRRFSRQGHSEHP